MELLTNLNYWQWWVIALIFIILEMFAPGAFMLWLGIAAAVVGLIMAIFPGMGWETQYSIFAIVSVISIVGWKQMQLRNPRETDQPNLNMRGHQYVDRTFTLDEPVVNGLGKIKVDDSTWKIEGEDCPAGTKVKVTGVDGVILKIEHI
jgi:membrane protein implicated in regulation of membrane protease activity